MTTAPVDTTAPRWSTARADPFRGRLLDGLASSIAERGYRDTTVADIVGHARTSKRTFYARVDAKQECFVELLRVNNDALIARSARRSIRTPTGTIRSARRSERMSTTSRRDPRSR